MSHENNPLVLAVKIGNTKCLKTIMPYNKSRVEDTDSEGKTALHWAASVNNVDAVNILLANGANRDAQDHKDETPLFLSCREGSYQAAKALLDHCANRDITDHMDRLPRDIAQERLHHDIGRLLEEHVPPAPQPQVSQPLVPPTTMPAVSEDGHQMTPTKPRMATLPKNRIPSFKKNKNEEMMMSPEDNQMFHLLTHSQHNLNTTSMPAVTERSQEDENEKIRVLTEERASHLHRVQKIEEQIKKLKTVMKLKNTYPALSIVSIRDEDSGDEDKMVQESLVDEEVEMMDMAGVEELYRRDEAGAGSESLPARDSGDHLHLQRTKLERAKTGDILKSKISLRPERTELVHRHILEDVRPDVDPSLCDRQRQLKRAKLADSLASQLSHMPGPLELIRKNILHTDETVETAVKEGTLTFRATSEGASSRGQPGTPLTFDEDSSDTAPSPAVDTGVLSPASGYVTRDTSSPNVTSLLAQFSDTNGAGHRSLRSESVGDITSVTSPQRLPDTEDLIKCDIFGGSGGNLSVAGHDVFISPNQHRDAPGKERKKLKAKKPGTAPKPTSFKFHEYKVSFKLCTIEIKLLIRAPGGLALMGLSTLRKDGRSKMLPPLRLLSDKMHTMQLMIEQKSRVVKELRSSLARSNSKKVRTELKSFRDQLPQNAESVTKKYP